MLPNESDKQLLIIVRQSPDWARLTHSEFKEESIRFCRSSNMPETLVYDAACLWDRTFPITYLATRQRMKEIARENWAKVRDSAVSETLPVSATGFGAVAFVDDDDWFHPDIATHLFANLLDCEGLIWDHLRVGHVKGEALQYRSESTSALLCFTNNYAVAPDIIEALGWERVCHHLAADATFPSLRTRRITEALSATSKHPASTLVLHAILSEDSSPLALIGAVKRYLSRITSLISREECRAARCDWIVPSLVEVQRWFEMVTEPF